MSESLDGSGLSELLGLLTILAKQLDMSLDESNIDFEKICALSSPLLQNNAANFGSGVFDGETAGETAKDELVVALQFHDRMSQRISHVSKSLKMIANHLNEIDYHLDKVTSGKLKLDLEDEIKKTLSFFNTAQAAQMCEMVSKNSAWLLDHEIQETSGDQKQKKIIEQDIEFF